MNNAKINGLTEKIEILKKQKKRTPHGVVVYEYQHYAKTWASVMGYSAKLTEGSVERRNEIDYKIIMRYRTDVHINDRIVYRGRVLEVINELTAIGGGKKFVYCNAAELVEDDE